LVIPTGVATVVLLGSPDRGGLLDRQPASGD
jgi:hypothetical protein